MGVKERATPCTPQPAEQRKASRCSDHWKIKNLYLYQGGHGRDRPLLPAGQNIDLRVHVDVEVIVVSVGYNHVGGGSGGLGRSFGSFGCGFASGSSSFEGLSSVHQHGSFTCSGDTRERWSHSGAERDETG